MAGDDRDRGNSPVDDWPPNFEHLVIPDDARELTADAKALQRERRAAARRRRLRETFQVRHWRRFPLSWPLAFIVLLAVIATSSLVVLFRPPAREVAKARPLASGSTRSPGQEGGLLPDIRVQRPTGGERPLRDFRPAVLVLLPETGCDCTPQLRDAVVSAHKHLIQVVAVGRQVPRLPDDLRTGGLVAVGDANATLATLYHVGDRPSLLFIRADGTVNRVLGSVPPPSSLDAEVVVLTA